MPITEKERKYLKNKHRGGKNNSKGAIYESFYAVYCIAYLMDKFIMNLESIQFTSQVENTFVDDLLIEINQTEKSYYQLKNVKDLTWSTGKLKYDFKRQMEISKERGENFNLRLIYSSPNSTVANIPHDISEHTTASFFPACESLNQLLQSCEYFKKAIKSITASDDIKDDQLFGVAGTLLGVWDGCEQKHISLKQISDKVLQIGSGLVNIKSYLDTNISEECKTIFKKCGVSTHSRGIKLYWSYEGKLKGEICWSDEVEHRIIETNPSSLYELLELLY